MSLDHHPDDTGAIVSPQELVQRPRELDEEMPEALHTQLLEAGATIVPDLLAVLEEVLADDQADYGWAPLNTAEDTEARWYTWASYVVRQCVDRLASSKFIRHTEACL